MIIAVLLIFVLDWWTKSNNTYTIETHRRNSGINKNIITKSNYSNNSKSSSNYLAEQWMSDYDGSIFEFEYQVKKLLDDPSSFEHVETSYSEQGLETKVRMKFRAKNKFGAKVLNQADALLNTNDGTVSNITIK
jgi:hypothetical protein